MKEKTIITLGDEPPRLSLPRFEAQQAKNQVAVRQLLDGDQETRCGAVTGAGTCQDDLYH